MQNKDGLRRYFYEHLFHHSVELVKAQTGKPLVISQARHLRATVDAKLAAQGLSMDDPDLKFTPVLRAMDEAFTEGVTDYRPMFANHTLSGSTVCQDAYNEFQNMIDFDHDDVKADPGPLGARLPISPYDPRFAQRHTVKLAGASLLYVPLSVLGSHSPRTLADVPTNDAGEVSMDSAMNLYTPNRYGEALDKAGPAYSYEDISGLTELMSFMSEREYNDVHDYMLAGGKNPRTGKYELNRFMSRSVVDRSVAILRELEDQGVDYSIRRDSNPGQIKVQITGTKMEIRLSDTRSDEDYVGRVYDNGMHALFTVPRTINKGKTDNEHKPPTMEPEDYVNLLRYCQGLPVQRADKPDKHVGQTERYSYTNKKTNEVTTLNSAYFVRQNHTAFYGKRLHSNKTGSTAPRISIRRDAGHRSSRIRFMKNEQDAERLLSADVDAARENFHDALNVEYLITQARDQRDAIAAGQWTPTFDSRASIAAIQRSYWSLLVDDASVRAGVDDALMSYDEQNENGEDIFDEADPEVVRRSVDLLIDGQVYSNLDLDDQIRAHSEHLMDEVVGTFEPREVTNPDTGEFETKRFDPVVVAQHMNSERGVWRNHDDIVASLRLLDIDPDELMGSSYHNDTIKDRMITFDSENSVSIDDVTEPFTKRMMQHVVETLQRNTCDVVDVRIDPQGIVRWQAIRESAQKVRDDNKHAQVVYGEIGQIIEPGEYGEIVTKFAGSENFMSVPGYEATIATQRPGESLTVEERTRLMGYEHLMASQINYHIANDLLDPHADSVVLGQPTSVNNVYRRLCDERHPVDFIENSLESGLDESWVSAILTTEGRRVKYPKSIRDESTISAAYRADHRPDVVDTNNDNFASPWALTGGRNMSIMTQEGDGYFDPIMTSSGTEQGIVRYLCKSASVNSDGSINRGESGDRTPLADHPDMAFCKYDPFDRQQMTMANVRRATAVTEPVGTAMMTLGGWTADDPLVISQEFAEKYQVDGPDGTKRPLIVGDKLSDFHGNKGVISLVIDRDMPHHEAIERDLEKEWQVFHDNPDLHVVMSPFSAVSRFNGGTAREMMSRPTQDLHLPQRLDETESQVVPGGIGELRFIVTHIRAKGLIYDDEAVASGLGRKASAQLAWALGAQGATHVLDECYGHNDRALANYREIINTMGLDITADGELRRGWEEHSEDDRRRLLEMPDLFTSDGKAVSKKELLTSFGALIGDRGGDLELPFALKFPTGDEIPTATDSTWKLPVMSSHLRAGRDLDDGTESVHDYTNHYINIFDNACAYRKAEQALLGDDGQPVNAQTRRELQETMARCRSKAQGAFDSITSNIEHRLLSGKNNVHKSWLMTARMPKSATAVWTSDPRLDIDQVAMSEEMAEQLDLAEGDYALIWRDPVLRDAGVRYMRVAINNDLVGVAINPVMDKCFDGDFDGDSVAVVKLTTRAAHEEAMEKLTVNNNLLDLGSYELTTDEIGQPTKKYDLAMHNSLDGKVSQYEAPQLAAQFEELTKRANDLLSVDQHSRSEIAVQQAGLVEDLSDYYREAMSFQYGGAALRFDSSEAHMASVIESCIETGAKGSMSKVAGYARYLQVHPETYESLPESQITHEDHEAVEYATAVKAFGTGVAGAYSQRGVLAARDVALKDVLELTYPVTQSMLQSKHDPIEARRKYELAMGPVRQLWQGREMAEVRGLHGAVTWEPVREKDGSYRQATPQEWVDQFTEIYTSKHGLNVDINPDSVRNVAQSLSKSGIMTNIDEDFSRSSTLDQLAYGGDFSTLVKMADNKRNIFDGELNKHFAPNVVKSNMAAIEKHDAALEESRVTGTPAPDIAMTPIVHKDTQAAQPGRGERKTSDRVVTTKDMSLDDLLKPSREHFGGSRSPSSSNDYDEYGF